MTEEAVVVEAKTVAQVQVEAAEDAVCAELDKKLGTNTPEEYKAKSVEDKADFEESVDVVLKTVEKFGIKAPAVRAKLIAMDKKFQSGKEMAISADFVEQEMMPLLGDFIRIDPAMSGKIMMGLVQEMDAYKEALGHLLATATLIELMVEGKEGFPKV